MIRSELDVLLERVEDPALREDLRTQIDRLSSAAASGSCSSSTSPSASGCPASIRIGSAVVSERFSDRFVRVESVARVEDGTLRVLDLADAPTRTAVLAFRGAKVTALYESEASRPYDQR